jgi:type IV pilus assembly protein PilN
MIRINLLPIQRGRIALRRQMTLAVVLLLAAIAGGAWFYDVQSRELTARRQELQRLAAELKRLEPIIKEVKEFETRKALLAQKVEVIGGLQTAQRRPARLLDEISRRLPEQVWLTQVRETEQAWTIVGKSFDNVGIASFMENLEGSRLFTNVGLVESKSEMLQGIEVKAFTVTARLAPAVTPAEPKTDKPRASKSKAGTS